MRGFAGSSNDNFIAVSFGMFGKILGHFRGAVRRNNTHITIDTKLFQFRNATSHRVKIRIASHDNCYFRITHFIKNLLGTIAAIYRKFRSANLDRICLNHLMIPFNICIRINCYDLFCTVLKPIFSGKGHLFSDVATMPKIKTEYTLLYNKTEQMKSFFRVFFYCILYNFHGSFPVILKQINNWRIFLRFQRIKGKGQKMNMF